jgi:uncharacterized membrane protein
MRAKGVRYYFIDGVRGLAIINMAIFHFLYDVFMIYGKNPLWYGLPVIRLWQQMICQTFIFISGFVWTWGKEGNLRRGLRFHFYGFMISMITLIVIPSETIWFGILNFMGFAVLLMFPLQKPFKHIPPVFGLGSSAFLFILCKQIQHGFVRVGAFLQIPVPDVFYSVKILTPFGFPFPEFRSSDYFPVVPWIFLYLCGYFFHEIFMRHEKWQRIACRKIPFLSAIGSRTIWIYLFHQPISMLICRVLF